MVAIARLAGVLIVAGIAGFAFAPVAQADSINAGGIICDSEASASVLREDNKIHRRAEEIFKRVRRDLKVQQLLADTDLSLARASESDSPEQAKRLRLREDDLARLRVYSGFLHECLQVSQALNFTILEKHPVGGLASGKIVKNGREEVAWTSIEFLQTISSVVARPISPIKK